MEGNESTEQNNIETSELDDAALESMISGEQQGDEVGQDDAADDNSQDDSEGGESADSGSESTENDGDTGSEDVVAKLQRQVDESQKMIQRQAQELGQLRTMAQPKPNPDEQNALFYNDPANAVRQTVQQTLHEQQQYRESVESQMREAVPEIDNNDFRQEVAKLALEDGFGQERVDAFMKDPYGTSDPSVVRQYALRIAHNKELAERDAKVGELEKQLEDLKKQLSTSHSDVASKIAKATQNTGRVSSANGQGGDNTGVVSEEQLAGLSDEELNKLLK